MSSPSSSIPCIHSSFNSVRVINVGVGTANEWSAEKTVAALESVGSPVATVLRHKPGAKGEGEITQMPTEDVVPCVNLMLHIYFAV